MPASVHPLGNATPGRTTLARRLRSARLCLLTTLALFPFSQAWSGESSDEFDRQRFKASLAQEIDFREAAIQVAWSAEPLCDDTQEIEPFVLWSTRTLRRGLSANQQALFTQATGMDGFWRVAWLDESAPDELKLGQRVLAINGQPLPEPSTKLELTAVLRGGSTLAVDEQAFWQLMHKVRDEASNGQQMRLTLEGGLELPVSTQTGCAGTVLASPFDDEPANFLRQEGRRSKIPGHALTAARGRDEMRWLAAFGLYFLASEHGLLRQRTADDMGRAFLLGKVLTLALPGAGTLLSAIEAQGQREIQVDGLVGSADLFANEVVLAMGGDPAAGLKLSDRLQAAGIRADVINLSEFRRSSMDLHLKHLQQVQVARREADLAAERAAEQAAKPAAETPTKLPGAPAPKAPSAASH